MSQDQPGSEQDFAFRQAQLYVHHARGDGLLRVIVHDALSDVLLVKHVGLKWDRVEKVASELPRAKALKLRRAGKLARQEECIRPDYLSLTDEELKERSGKALADAEKWLRARDEAYELIRSLVEVPEGVERRDEALALRLVLTYSPQTHAKVVAAHADEMGVKPIVIKRLLHKYAWFGMDKNALLNRDPFKGWVDSFPKKYRSKTGRPNAAMMLGFDSQHGGRNVTAADMRIFKEVLDKLYVAKDYTLQKTYDEMVETRYYRENQHGFSPIRRSRIPTWGQFYYHAVRLITLLGMRPLKEGEKDGKEMQERRGYDTDISGAVGEVYDIDGTPFNKQLVCRYKVNGQTLNLGKATALVVFDRDSKKATGWHVYVGAENWKEGYRLALFCALTSKVKHLERLGIDDPTAFADNENIVPSSVYVDGGPGASNSGREALKRLRIDFKLAPPDTPFWKPTAEGGLGHSQADQATDAGGYDRRNRARSKGKKRSAKLFAAETIFELEKKLVEHLIRYNRSLDKRHLLTDRMKEDGVPASSQGIFSWGVRKMGGVQNRIWREADVYLALLEHKEGVQVTVDGIALHGARYRSARLRAFRQRAGSNVCITVMYHPLRLWEAYWITPDGTLDELERDGEGNRNNGPASAYDIERWSLYLTAANIVEADKRPKRPGNLSRRQRDQMLSESNAVPKRQRKRPTRDESFARRAEQALEAGQRAYDRPEVHLPGQYAPAIAPVSSSPVPPAVTPQTQSSTMRQGGPGFGSPGGGASIGRMKTAELFARRSQAAVKKGGPGDNGKH